MENFTEEEILRLNDPEISTWHASNVILHEQVLLEYNNPDYCLEFALTVKGATIEYNIKEADKSIERYLNFAKCVQGANREKLKDATSKLPRYSKFKLEFYKLHIIPNSDNNSDVVIPDRIINKMLRLKKQD